MWLKEIGCAFAAIALVACTQRAPVMSEAQLVGKWSCNVVEADDSNGSAWAARGQSEIRADHTYTVVSDEQSGSLKVRILEAGTWHLEGDVVDFTLSGDEAIVLSNSFGGSNKRNRHSTLRSGFRLSPE